MLQSSNRTVLIADDDADARAFLAGLVELMLPEATTLLASDGLDALGVASDVRPWAVVLDLDMPRLDGLEAARRLQGRMGKDVPILIATSGDHERLHAAYAIFDYSLRKPIDVERLARYLARALVFPDERSALQSKASTSV
jgi:two-component system response regulator MprA